MKKFRFSLESLRVLREQKEKLAQQQYAATLRACEDAAVKVQTASAELTTCWNTLSERLAAGLGGTELLRARAWCNVLELQMKDRVRALEQARHALDSVWQGMVAASRD